MGIIQNLGWQSFVEVPATLEVLRRVTETGPGASPFATDTEAYYLEREVARIELSKSNDHGFAAISKRTQRRMQTVPAPTHPAAGAVA
jgi:hypothetical protein